MRSSVEEMERNYELKQRFMPQIYDTVIKLRGEEMASKFYNEYKAIRYEVVEFVRKIGEAAMLDGQTMVRLQNALSQIISVSKRARSPDTIREYMSKCIIPIYDLYSVGWLSDTQVIEIYRFLVQHGVPENIVRTFFRTYGLPVP